MCLWFLISWHPGLLINELWQELIADPFTSSHKVASAVWVFMLGYDIWKHVASVFAQYIYLVFIIVTLLNYYLRGIFIAIKYTTCLSILEVSFSLLFAFFLAETSSLSIILFEHSTTIGSTSCAHGYLALIVLLLQLLHDLLGLVRHGQEMCGILLLLLISLLLDSCHKHPGFTRGAVACCPLAFLNIGGSLSVAAKEGLCCTPNIGLTCTVRNFR